MKVNKKILEGIFILVVCVINIYLLYLNVSISSYDNLNEARSTANHINLEQDENLLEESEEKIAIEELVNPIVYDGMTIDELAEKLNKSLNSTISGKGYLIATYSLEKNVDPYMAVAIMLHETGCKWECSTLVKECNNVGGQKGYGCGSYNYFNSLDEGIRGFIDNLSNNYISKGLTTPEEINPKYAESTTWSEKVNKYIEEIKVQ